MSQRELYLTSESNPNDNLKEQNRAFAYGLGDFIKTGIDINNNYTIHSLACQTKVNIKFNNPNAKKNDLLSLHSNLQSIVINSGFENNNYITSRTIIVNANDTIETFAKKINNMGNHDLGFTAHVMNCHLGESDPVIMISSKHFGIKKGFLEIIDESNSLDINYYKRASNPVLEILGINGVSQIGEVLVFDPDNLNTSNYGDFKIYLWDNFIILLKIKMLNGSPETFRIMDFSN
jgi:hypothetical protein